MSVVPQLLAPELFRRIIDSSTFTAPSSSTWPLAVGYLLLALVGQGLTLGLTYLTTRLAATATTQLREELVEHALRQEPAFFRRFTPGELVERVDGDSGRLGEIVSGVLVDIVAQLLLAVGVIAALFYLDWRFGLLFTPFAIAMATLLSRQTGRALPHVAAERKIEAEVVGFIDEQVSGADDIRANGATPAVRQSLWALLDTSSEKGRRAAEMSARWPATIQGLSALSVVAALALGGWLHSMGLATVGTVFAALSYATLIRFPLARLTLRIQDVENAAVSLHRLDELRLMETRVDDGPTTLRPDDSAVVFDDVSFAYEGGPEVLSGLSFRLPTGQTMAVVGQTGSGKSTLLGLLFRRFDPTRGTIRIGGQDLRDLNVRALRDRVTYIPQSGRLLATTVRNNVALFDERVNDLRVESALRTVGLGPWLDQLPMGLDTALKPQDAPMSLGQTQLLNLARALITEPSVVLLDEPSAMLDPHTERHLKLALARFLRGRTAIVVSHRLDILDGVDWVLVLDDGRAAEFGERSVLAAEPASRFNTLTAVGRSPS
ncbi:ABC transporter ATP-binding protein [Micromonospora ureilytica]|uniref:ABC transporter ATP-binding protein n=1 Tax=Micromonospora ureilytica TaxID=709868 RepID=UPI0034048BC2